MIKGSVQQEDITIINIYAPNTRAPAYVKQILTELTEEIECNAFILGDFNTPGVLTSPRMNALHSISSFNSVSICFTYVRAPVWVHIYL